MMQSPSKKVALPQAPPAVFEGLRGSYAAAADVGMKDAIRQRSAHIRYAVNTGQVGGLPRPSVGRPLTATQSLPANMFSQNVPFITSNEILDNVFSSGGSSRTNELRPYGETASNASPSRRRNATLDPGYANERGDGMMQDDDDDGGDGFDVDEVYQETSSFEPRVLLFGGVAEDASRRSNKRGLDEEEEEEPEGAGAEDDVEMAPTDTEEDGDDDLEIPIASIIQKRSFGRTASLPANAFERNF